MLPLMDLTQDKSLNSVYLRGSSPQVIRLLFPYLVGYLVLTSLGVKSAASIGLSPVDIHREGDAVSKLMSGFPMAVRNHTPMSPETGQQLPD
jgi:hypothetical protein